MMRKLLRCENGTGMVEFALVAPFLVLVFMGLLELGRYTYYSILAAHAARAAAAYGSQNTTSVKDTTGMQNVAVADGGNLTTWTTNGQGAVSAQPLCSVNGSALSTCGANASSPPANTVYYVSVTVTGRFHTLVHYPGLPDDVWVSGSSTMRVSGQ
ncbi:MAG TPA: TadE family protein [Candidatus Cybelea sp.]|jgi:Flp pilus assembly protein TadG|nr:TadE family protein [Candidatus Cybelea sp.]